MITLKNLVIKSIDVTRAVNEVLTIKIKLDNGAGLTSTLKYSYKADDPDPSGTVIVNTAFVNFCKACGVEPHRGMDLNDLIGCNVSELEIGTLR